MLICPRCGNKSYFDKMKFCKICGVTEGHRFHLRYRIIERLRSGSSYVYLAMDERLNRKCIVKQAPDYSFFSSTEQIEMKNILEKELRILASLSHPNLITVSDSFHDQDGFCIVMDFVDGQTLQQILDDNWNPQAEDQVLDWGIQLCDVLSYLHKQTPPIIHRDVKPVNIILEKSNRNRIKLMDFSIARFYRPNLSKDEELVGTPGYASPEQHGTAQTDGRSDIYSLGATLYCLLTKYDPSENPFQFPEIRSLNPKVSEQTSDVIFRALQTDRKNRYQSADEMKMTLEAIVRTKTESSRLPKEEQISIQKLITNKQRRLQKLKEQQSLFGLNTPPEILIEIEDIESDLKKLKTELN